MVLYIKLIFIRNVNCKYVNICMLYICENREKNLFNFIDVCILFDKINEGNISVYFLKV